MRALFHLRPATGADRTLRLCAALRLRPVRRLRESGPEATPGVPVRATRDSLTAYQIW